MDILTIADKAEVLPEGIIPLEVPNSPEGLILPKVTISQYSFWHGQVERSGNIFGDAKL